jgi:hypothetical protein
LLLVCLFGLVTLLVFLGNSRHDEDKSPRENRKRMYVRTIDLLLVWFVYDYQLSTRK